MGIATIMLEKLIHDSQDYGSNDEHMVSRLFFQMEIEGATYPDLYVDIKQPVGSSLENSALDVSSPHNYKGPFNYEAFRTIVERYYRNLVGTTSLGINLSGGSTNIRRHSNTFIHPLFDQFEVLVTGGG